MNQTSRSFEMHDNALWIPLSFLSARVSLQLQLDFREGERWLVVRIPPDSTRDYLEEEDPYDANNDPCLANEV